MLNLNFTAFTTQASTILVTVITFMVYYFIGDSRELSAGNVFAGLALFSQLSIPLLVLPVTVLMVIQATVSNNYTVTRTLCFYFWNITLDPFSSPFTLILHLVVFLLKIKSIFSF